MIAVNLDRDVASPFKDERSTPNLSTLIGQALQKSPQLKQAQAQFEAAQARSGVSHAELLPALSLRIAGGPEKSTGDAWFTQTQLRNSFRSPNPAHLQPDADQGV